jgi:endo-1,4-beta-xylanase
MSRFIATLMILGLLLSFSASQLYTRVSAKPMTLRQVATSKHFLFGAAGSIWKFTPDGSYQNTLAAQFNMTTPENELKWFATEPEPGDFHFYWGDKIVAFAQQNNMRIHGHTLVWFDSLPDWVTNGTFTRDELIAVLKRHIETIMLHYKGKIQEWDVVNEAIEHSGNGLRDNIFLRVIGPEYIDMAFQFAHEADPNAILFYNDFGTENWPLKSNTQFSLLKGMLQRGVPVNAVGLQMHEYSDNPIPVQVYKTELQRLASLGLRVGVTEFDASSKEPQKNPLAMRLAVQAQTYANAVDACLSVPACKSFTIWGVNDKTTHQADLAPVIFDVNNQPKPAYTSVMNTLLRAK